MNCMVCGRKTESKFCDLHMGAYKSLLKSYEAWKRAMRVSWAEYLARVQNNEFAGLWVKEVVRYLLTSGSLEEPDCEIEL